MAQHMVARTLAGDEDAPRIARTLMTGLLEQLTPLPGDRGADVTLAVSELVSNAFLHGPPGNIDLRLSASADVIRIEVGDRGVMPFDLPHASADNGHWGLRLVQRFSDRCGIERTPSTLAWCEFDYARA